MRIYRYTVSGKYPFPADMLRYDRAFPTHSAEAIMPSPTGMYDGKVITVDLAGLNPPTMFRWYAFGWAVDEDSITWQTNQIP